MTNTRTGEYRIKARDALAQANRTTDAASRLRFLEWATHWLRLAQMGEKNDQVELVAERREAWSGRSERRTGRSV
jgi:hypothetical protein